MIKAIDDLSWGWSDVKLHISRALSKPVWNAILTAANLPSKEDVAKYASGERGQQSTSTGSTGTGELATQMQSKDPCKPDQKGNTEDEDTCKRWKSEHTWRIQVPPLPQTVRRLPSDKATGGALREDERNTAPAHRQKRPAVGNETTCATWSRFALLEQLERRAKRPRVE
eukprot:204836-Amphidinium_carterae.1